MIKVTLFNQYADKTEILKKMKKNMMKKNTKMMKMTKKKKNIDD